MKKLLISILIIGALASFGADRQYAYKMLDGKLAKFKIITSDEASAYQAKGYTVESDKMKTCKIVGETVFLRFETVTSQERILAQSKFAKLDIRRAMRAIVIPATQTTPQTTQEAVLDAILASSPVFAKDWADAADINLDDPLVKQALQSGSIDVDKVKLKILELQK